MIDHTSFEYAKVFVYYASYLYFPAAACLLWVMAKGAGAARPAGGVLLAGLSVLAYARFVEPRILLTRQHDVALAGCFEAAGTARLAVFSDAHIGMFGNAIPMARIARRLAAANPDAVLIAGDFVYFLEPEKFTQSYAPLSSAGAPVFAVLGNHDVGIPGPDVGALLSAALTDLGVDDIDNASERIETAGGAVEIAGLSDSWQGRQEMSVIETPSAIPRILLTHNPKTVFDLPADADVDLLVAGHTHGGQIRIPGLTCVLLRDMCAVALYGLVETARGKVFVTSGTGMVGLPMRFLAPPRIDILNLRYEACE